MQNQNQPDPVHTKDNQTGKGATFKAIAKQSLSALSEYVEILLGIISIWATLVIFFKMKHMLPELGWPYFLDEVLFFILIFILCFLTSIILKPLVLIAMVVGCLYLSVQWIVDAGTKKTPQKVAVHMTMDDDFFMFWSGKTGKVEQANHKIDSLEQKLNLLARKQLLLQQQLDSMKKTTR